MKKFLLSLTLLLCLCATVRAAAPSGSLPVLHINTDKNAPITSKDTYITGTYWLDPRGAADIEALGSQQEPLALQIRGRGNFSWESFDKKPYRIKLDKKAALMGCPKSKHFVLLAHADDNNGFLRNAVGFQLSRMIGLAWTPTDCPVELVINGDYKGLYFLTETVRAAHDRVNIIEQIDEATEDVSGGWIVEIDNYSTDPHIAIDETDGWPIIITYKSPEVPSQQQEDFLRSEMTEINSLIYDSNKNDCKWAKKVDIDSLARFFIVQEIVDNYEAFHGSCYMHRQYGDDEKWIFGPVWDFGSAFIHDKSQYIYQGREHHMTWIREMCTFPTFMDKVKEVWNDFLEEDAGPGILDYVDTFSDAITDATKADFERWPKYGTNDESAKAEAVKRKLTRSFNWLARQWGGQPGLTTETSVTVTFEDNGNPAWDVVYAYVWENGKSIIGDWPGTPCERIESDGNPRWRITFTPDHQLSADAGLIFNNGHSGVGKNQTEDFILTNGGTYTRVGLSSVADAETSDISPEITAIGFGTISIWSPTACTVSAATLDGRTFSITLTQGDNTIALPRGFYIILGRKVAVR